MNRRDFNLAAAMGLAAGAAALPQGAGAAGRGFGRSFTMDLLGESKRVVSLDAPSGDTLTLPKYALTSHCKLTMSFNRDGTGALTGKALRLVSGILDPSYSQASVPVKETTNFVYEFSYERNGDSLTMLLKEGSWKGLYLSGPSQSKGFAVTLALPSGTPFLEGHLDRQNQRIALSTPDLLNAMTQRSDGVTTYSAFSIQAFGTLAVSSG